MKIVFEEDISISRKSEEYVRVSKSFKTERWPGHVVFFLT